MNNNAAQTITGYNHGYLDEQTKRMIRRGILKAVAIRCRSPDVKCRCLTAGAPVGSS
jgi:alpha-D-ribose 1-methylphosphonate 5-phosphate C-P lyase